MYTCIEHRFNEIALKLLQINKQSDLLDFDVIAEKLGFEIKYSKKLKSCYYIVSQKMIECSYVVLHDTPKLALKKQFKEFYHEVAHHLLHMQSTPENEAQCNICWLFLVIPKSELYYTLKSAQFNVDIESFADYFNVSQSDMILRLEHFNENNFISIDWISMKDAT